jgi:hypothetical protein
MDGNKIPYSERVGHQSAPMSALRSSQYRVSYGGLDDFGGLLKSVDVPHTSLAEVIGHAVPRNKAKWCKTCQRGRHAQCGGKWRTAAKTWAPCECPKCMERRAEL